MGNLRVLLVDDEVELVETVAERLLIRGFDPDVATNGEDALRSLLDANFDVVLLDIRMPGISGLEVLKLIRRQRPSTQVILMTGHISAEEAEGGLLDGAFDYLVKPIDIEALVAKLKAAGRQSEKIARSTPPLPRTSPTMSTS